MFCKVHSCPHASFHVTSDHYCRLCQAKGHGTYECNNVFLKQALEPFLSEELPTSHFCQFPNCTRAHFHISEAHFCHTCRHLVPCLHFSFGLPLGIRSSLVASPLSPGSSSPPPSPSSPSSPSLTPFKASKEEKDRTLVCPMCRTKNHISSKQAKLYHDNPATCVVCQDRPVSVFLPMCGHAILCNTCADKLQEKN